MKKLFFLAFVLISVASCKKESACTVDSFVGTWKGTETCTLIPGSTDVSVDITNSSGKLIVDDGSDVINISCTVDGCDFEGGTSVLGVGEKLTGTLAGTALSMTYKVGAGVASNTCTYVLKK